MTSRRCFAHSATKAASTPAFPARSPPLKFSSPIGVGADTAGNIYIASSHVGTVLESYSPAGQRNWEIHGLEFVECADVDPASPNDVYTLTHHYVLNLSKPAGRDATYTGYIVDAFGVPDDPRLHGHGCGSMFARRIQGKLFLFGLDMNASTLQIYRFTGKGELTAPAGMIRPTHNRGYWPDHQPGDGGWIWRDRNGDGKIAADEYDASPDNLPTTAWSIDPRGDVWTGLYTQRGAERITRIRRFPCQGLDGHGNPVYTFASAVDVPVPPPFDDIAHGSSLTRMQYVPETDTMYLSGFTPEHKNEHRDWKTSGPGHLPLRPLERHARQAMADHCPL